MKSKIISGDEATKHFRKQKSVGTDAVPAVPADAGKGDDEFMTVTEVAVIMRGDGTKCVCGRRRVN